MKYYRMQFSDATKATEEVWRRQDTAQIPHTSFRMSAEGRDTSVWTQDPDGEALFRCVLHDLSLPYEEGETQQVMTWLDGFF